MPDGIRCKMPRMKKTPEISSRLSSDVWPEQQWRGGAVPAEDDPQLPRPDPVVSVSETDRASAIRYTKTTKGKDAIVYDGYIYILNKRTESGRSYWICRNRDTCSARLNLDSGDRIIKSTGHYHLPCPEEILRLDFFSDMTRQINESPDKPVEQMYDLTRERFQILFPYETDFPRLSDIKKSLQLAREQSPTEREDGLNDDERLAFDDTDTDNEDDEEEEEDDVKPQGLHQGQDDKLQGLHQGHHDEQEGPRPEQGTVVKEQERQHHREICDEINEKIEDIYNFT